MNRRILRNGVLTLGMMLSAVWLPAQTAPVRTESCTTQACQSCVASVLEEYYICIGYCATTGADSSCALYCDTLYQLKSTACETL